MLLAPSLYEGFGMTILEAMACGTPVITSNVSAMPEVAGDAGVLVDPTNYQAIADAVCHLHKNPVYYQELVEKGLARVKSLLGKEVQRKLLKYMKKFYIKNNYK
jgi:glycosyltransferase involved in cell wall biosynthesis